MTDKPTRAFTLIELLVVISIVALLIAILLPSLAAARMRAQAITCASNLRSVGMADLLYAQDHDDYLAPNAGSTQGEYSNNPQLIAAPLLIAQGYLSTHRVLYSPSDAQRTLGQYEGAWEYFYANGYPPGNLFGGPMRISLVFREPTSDAFQQRQPGNFFYPLYRIGDIQNMAIIADRFTGNHVWSFHNPQGRLPSQNNTGALNGEGWHVTFSDGHTSFYKNEIGIYEIGSFSGAAAGWNNRHLNWTYWDKH